MSVQGQINKLEEEIKAIKASFEQSAAQMPMYSSEITFTTSMNMVRYTHPPINPLEWATLVSLPNIDQNTSCGVEPIIVTFTCDKGINTFANLEILVIESLDGLFVTTVRRIPYSGGARWLVTAQPNHEYKQDGYVEWHPTKLKFVVKSAVTGTLGAKMIWE